MSTNNRAELLTPVGRLVTGSLYTPQTTDAENRPLKDASGKDRVNYFFGIAIKKGAEQHWNQTEWGAKIWGAGQAGFPNGQTNSPSFAWKVEDGDSQLPNSRGVKNCDREGYAGHWILKFSSGFAPAIYDAKGERKIIEEDFVNGGDYIQVYGSVSPNGSMQQPGVYLNHQYVAFAGYGKRIVTGPDPKAVGFGNAPVPPEASVVPLSQGFNPAPAAAPVTPPVAQAPAATPTYVTPHTGILNPPMPPVPPAALSVPAVPPVRKMTEKAQGHTYEQLIAGGWTDQMLVQHGYMEA